MIGQVVSHYKILEKLGEGGMGIVYKAHDTKLDRTVALKFLPPQVSATEQDKTRFTQEARAAAALNHPHICHIYRIDEVDAPPASGRQGEKMMFIEMEHVDGLTLRKRIAAGPIPLGEALNLATQIGEGLEEAHGKGIIHRDIKSDNVMVNSRGQAKVMDFGLAKLKGALKLTRSSSTVGTLAYMAPEQLRGAEADARSDIFSFGVLLYEMITGRVPFEGAHEAALMYSITNEPPVPLEKYLPGAPSELLHIINRSLEKDPEDRYQSVHDMVIDIRRMRKDSTRVSHVSMSAMPSTSPAGQTGSYPSSGATPAPSAVTPRPTGSYGVGSGSGEVPAGAGTPSGEYQPQPPQADHAGPASGVSARRTSSVTIQIPTGGKSWMMIAGVVVLIGLAVVGYMKFGGSDEPTGKLSIAVADFQNRTNEPELDGLSGMLTTAMEQSKRLSVVTRTHMFDILKQMGKADIERIDESVGKEICAKAGIGALVTASIQKFGKLYIIDLKVLDPSKNEYLFTAKEEGEGQESIPGMLDKLSEKTRAGLKEKADEIKASGTDLAVVTTSNLEAYQHFFKGEELINKLEIAKAVEELRQAVALDSMFGLAWYRLAYALDWSTATTGDRNDALPRALALIDRLPDKEKYLLRSIAARENANFAASVKILKEMETHYPNDKEMMYNIGDWSFHDNDLATAAEYLNKTLAIDPTHDRALQHLTWTYRDAGQYVKMLETARKYVEVAKSSESFELLAAAFSHTGKLDEGLTDFAKLRVSYPRSGDVVRSIAGFYQLQGEYDSAEAGLRQFVDSTGKLRNSAAYGLIDLYGFTGRHRKVAEVATAQIERALTKKDTVAAVNLMLKVAFADINLTGSVKKAGELLNRTYQYNLPTSDLDYWFPKTWLEILVDPRKDIHPDMLGKPWSPIYLSALASARNECGDAQATADTIILGGPPFVKFTLMCQIAECYYDASRYNDALSALNRAMVITEMATSSGYPQAVVLMGKIYEEMGNTALALESYGKFLKIWKQADPDLPMLVDVKKRVAKLKAVSSN